MASSGNLQKKLKLLSDHQRALWDAFEKAENESSLPSFPTIKFIALHKYSVPLCKKGKLSWFLYPPLSHAAVYIVAVLTSYLMTESQFSSEIAGTYTFAMVLGIIVLFFTMVWLSKSEKKFHDVHSNSILSVNEYATYSFGFDHTALMTHYFFKEVKESNIKKDDIASILKIIKAKNEMEDVSRITTEGVKSFMFKLLAAVPALLYHNFDKFKDVMNKILGSNSLFVKGYVIFVIVYFPFAMYAFVFSSIKARKKIKRYQVALNIIHESWVDK